MSMYPENLLYMIKKMQGYSRNNCKILPLTSTTSQNGGVVQVRLPTNSLISLESFALHGNMTVTGATKAATFARHSSSLIRSMQVQVGGQTVQHLNNYGTVWSALQQSTQGVNASSSNKLLEFDAPVVAITKSMTTPTPFIVKDMLGFFQASPSIIDTSLLGEIVISFTIESDPLKYSFNETGCTGVSLALSNLFCSLDIISIQDGVYDMVAQQALQSGLQLEIPIPSYYTFQHAAASDDYNTQFTIGCQSLDACMVLQTLSGQGFANNSTISAANGLVVQRGLAFDGASACVTDGDGWYFQVNGSQVPSHRVNKQNTPYYQKLAFGVMGADHGNQHAISIVRDDIESGWKAADLTLVDSTQYIPVVRFNHSSADRRLLSGVDARSNPVSLQFNHKSDGGSAVPKTVLVVALVTSTMTIGAGQQISFSA